MTSDDPVDEVGSVGEPKETASAAYPVEDVDDVEDVEDTEDTIDAEPRDTITEPAEAGEEHESPAQRYLVLGAAGLAAASLIVAAVFGIQWWASSGDDNVALAQARDQVVQAGRAAVKAYMDMDYTKPDAFVQGVLAVSDSNMQQQFKSGEANYRQAMASAKTKVTSTVQDIGVEELDDHDGKASFLAAVSYLVTADGQPPAPKELRVEVQMTRVGQDWKLSGIGSVPTVTGGQ